MYRKAKPQLFLVVVTLLTFLAVLVGCSSNASPTTSTPAQTTTTAPTSTTQAPNTTTPPAAVIKLTASNYLPPTHAFTPLMEEWTKEINKRSNGRVEITYFPGGALLTAPKTADGLQQGLADIGLSHIGYTPGRFPVTEALDLPMGYPSSWVGTMVAQDYLAKFKPKEWQVIKPLVIHAGTTAGLNMAKKAVRKLEDLKGLTMRGAGEVADALTALGAVPRDMPMADVYEALSKGTIDGLLVGVETLKAFKLADVCKYSTFAWQVGNMYTFYIAMNQEKWDKLPADIQKIFNDVDAEYVNKFAVKWNEINAEGFRYTLEKGNEVITLSADEGNRWKAAVQPVVDNYPVKMAKAGTISEADAKAQIAFIKERIAYWTPLEKGQNIPSEFDYLPK